MGYDTRSVPPTDTVQVRGVEFQQADLHRVVDAFYGRVAVDPVLSVPFASVKDWPEHIERLTHFWWIKFGGRPYLLAYYNPIEKHFFAGFSAAFLERWLGMFHEVLGEKLNPEQASLWKQVSSGMGQALLARNEEFRVVYEKEKSEGK